MKVRALHRINYNGTLYTAGQEFEIPASAAEELSEYTETVEKSVFEDTPKRGRPRKTEI